MEWKVYRIADNRDEVETFNVFDHFYFLEGCAKAAKEKEITKEQFSERIKSELFYYYGSKIRVGDLDLLSDFPWR